MLNNIKIGRLLSFAFVILIVFVLAVGGIGLTNLYNSNRDAGSIYNEAVTPISNLSSISNNLLRVHANNILMLYQHDVAKFYILNAEVSQWMSENDEIIKRFEGLKLTKEQTFVLDEFKTALTEYKEILAKNVDLLRNQDFSQAMSMLADLTKKQQAVLNRCDELVDITDLSAAKLKDNVAHNFDGSLLVMVGALALALLLAILLSIVIPRSIKRVINDLKGIAHKVAQGELDVDVKIKARNEFGELAGSFAIVIDNLRSLIEEAGALTDSASKGRFDVRANSDDFGGGYKEILEGFNNTLDTVVDKIYWYEGLLDSIPNPITVTDMDMNWTFVNKGVTDLLGTTREELMGQQCSNWNANICQTENCGIARLRNGFRDTIFEQFGRNFHVSTSYLTDRHGENVGHIELVSDVTKDQRKSKYQNAEVDRLAQNLDRLASGNLDFELDIAAADEYTSEDFEHFKKISNSFRQARENLSGYIEEIANILGKVAQGDLDAQATGDFKGEFAQIKESMSRILDSLNEMMLQINQSSAQVLSGAGQVASAAQALSRGSTEQASSIEELSASIEDISRQIKQNATGAQEARAIALNSSETLESAKKQMSDMMKAMENISDSSQKISKIIKTIDEIAFQTNILALNAAVEAARAGEAGKGFAVVADEVRNLASKSADAAKDTATLIENSILAVEQGTKLAGATADTLRRVVEDSQKTGELIAQISQNSSEQALAIAQTTQGVGQISSVVQTNSATAEESAAASEELSGQADMLNQLVGKFNLRKTEPLTFEVSPQSKKVEIAHIVNSPAGSKY